MGVRNRVGDPVRGCVGLPFTIGIVTIFPSNVSRLALQCLSQHMGIASHASVPWKACSYPDIVKMDFSPSDISVTPSSQPCMCQPTRHLLALFKGAVYL